MGLCQGWGSLQQFSTDVQEYRTERCRRWSWTSPGTGPRSKLPVSVWSSRMRRRCGRWLWPYPEQHSCSNANICDYFANRKYQGLQAYLIKLQLLLEIQGENRFHAIIWISFTELVTNDKEHSVGILDFLKQEEFMFHENHVLMKIDFNYPLKKKKQSPSPSSRHVSLDQNHQSCHCDPSWNRPSAHWQLHHVTLSFWILNNRVQLVFSEWE